MKFRKKPVVIEAVRFNGLETEDMVNTFSEYPEWLVKALKDDVIHYKYHGDMCVIESLEGQMKISPGDYLIQGVNGELYPCKPGIFEKTYEIVGD